ncbi:hypothetical protein PF005_g280 [Phytophthora fragariae]|uniref:Uncharacterized protein n=2 Tax=Phytophthora TaxID=4783 RepID=A0A6A3M3M0_9STRA|nr:hypothetical protein PF003_g26368 [Phytophthora fragariae]KAE9023068.1 hypothetical protein PR001_g13000 [Phytophthora rubi]KAE8950239.1 hypothetical protein PF009_g228 [Phytophthora fragariae]KAE9026681.1 hypothetical protein PF011_g2422 [Phytophthora fragariae]KAE9048161.1 hypothetical protein PR002_g634 [Phytophthora rubi]
MTAAKAEARKASCCCCCCSCLSPPLAAWICLHVTRRPALSVQSRRVQLGSWQFDVRLSTPRRSSRIAEVKATSTRSSVSISRVGSAATRSSSTAADVDR